MIEFIISIFTYQAEGVSQAIGPAAFLIPGALQAIGGLVGGKARRAEEQKARAEYAESKQNYMNLDTSNPYENVVNPYEDLEVNTQQADFLAQQQNQQQANMLASLRGAAGGSGVAGLAQVMANQGTKNLQKASASIGAQEAKNQQLSAKGAAAQQSMKLKGEVYSRGLVKDRSETLLGMSQTRLREAKAARQAARNQVMAGIGSMGSSMIGLASTESGMDMLKTTEFFTGKPK